MERHERYTQKIPIEARLAAEGLSGQNDIRWAVVAALMEQTEEPFSGLKERLDLHQQRLSDALDALQTGGIVKKEARERTGDQYEGYYKLTKFGKKILDGFYDATEPKYKAPEKGVEFTAAPNIRGAKVAQLNVRDVSERKPVTTEKVAANMSPVGNIEEVQP